MADITISFPPVEFPEPLKRSLAMTGECVRAFLAHVDGGDASPADVDVAARYRLALDELRARSDG